MNVERAKDRLWSSGEEGLILLIGASPLPNLVVAAALQPPRIALICSTDTEPSVDRFLRVLRQVYSPSVEAFGPGDHLTLRDPYRAAWIREDLGPHARRLARFGLFYTGGTKTMAVHAYEVWAQAGGTPGRACYLSDRDRLLRFDDDSSVDVLDCVHLDLPALGDLHGFTDVTYQELRESDVSVRAGQVGSRSTQDTSGKQGLPNREDVERVLQAVLTEPALVPRLYELGSVKKNGRDERIEGRKDIATPRHLHAHVPDLSVAFLDDSLPNRVIKAWGRFLRGVWLEQAVEGFVDRAAQQPPGGIQQEDAFGRRSAAPVGS